MGNHETCSKPVNAHQCLKLSICAHGFISTTAEASQSVSKVEMTLHWLSQSYKFSSFYLWSWVLPSVSGQEARLLEHHQLWCWPPANCSQTMQLHQNSALFKVYYFILDYCLLYTVFVLQLKLFAFWWIWLLLTEKCCQIFVALPRYAVLSSKQYWSVFGRKHPVVCTDQNRREEVKEVFGIGHVK